MELKNNLGISCFLCGEDHPAVLKKMERHHIDGRINSEEIIAICYNCHNKITIEFNKLSPKDRINNKKLSKISYLILNHGGLLKNLGEKQIKIAKELIDYEKDNVKSIYKD